MLDADGADRGCDIPRLTQVWKIFATARATRAVQLAYKWRVAEDNWSIRDDLSIIICLIRFAMGYFSDSFFFQKIHFKVLWIRARLVQ